MKTITLILITFLCSRNQLWALDNCEKQFAPLGFTCSEKDGLICEGRIKNYPLSVFIIAPPKFKVSDPIEVVLHLPESTLSPTDIQFFAQTLSNSELNLLLVIPNTQSNAATLSKHLIRGKLVFESFVQNLNTILKKSCLASSASASTYYRIKAISAVGDAYDPVSKLAYIDSQSLKELAGLGLFSTIKDEIPSISRLAKKVLKNNGHVYLSYSSQSKFIKNAQILLKNMNAAEDSQKIKAVESADPNINPNNLVNLYYADFLKTLRD